MVALPLNHRSRQRNLMQSVSHMALHVAADSLHDIPMRKIMARFAADLYQFQRVYKEWLEHVTFKQ